MRLIRLNEHRRRELDLYTFGDNCGGRRKVTIGHQLDQETRFAVFIASLCFHFSFRVTHKVHSLLLVLSLLIERHVPDNVISKWTTKRYDVIVFWPVFLSGFSGVNLMQFKTDVDDVVRIDLERM